MKFLLFSDLHYEPGLWDGGTWEDLHILQKHAEEENCDFIIHAGDFCGGQSNADEYIKAYNDFHIPSYHCLGNHDADKCTFEEILRKFKMPADYYYFDCKGYRMVILNPNVYYLDGEHVHYSLGNYYKHPDARDHLPPEQLVWLEKILAETPYPCILISHESFERPDGVQNREEVRKIIDDANRRKPGTVLMCINGHYHRDYIRILNNVCYYDMISASFDYMPVTHSLFTEDIMNQYPHAKHTVVFNDPLHAIVELEGSTITIKGMESSMFQGITREMTGNTPGDEAGRELRPVVQSAKITLG